MRWFSSRGGAKLLNVEYPHRYLEIDAHRGWRVHRHSNTQTHGHRVKDTNTENDRRTEGDQDGRTEQLFNVTREVTDLSEQGTMSVAVAGGPRLSPPPVATVLFDKP